MLYCAPTMNEALPTILVTNDDGIAAPGLHLLARELAALGEVTIIAPDREQSAYSHALTLHRPLRVNRQAERLYSVDGTPTDCVNLGILTLLVSRPRLWPFRKPSRKLIKVDIVIKFRAFVTTTSRRSTSMGLAQVHRDRDSAGPADTNGASGKTQCLSL